MNITNIKGELILEFDKEEYNISNYQIKMIKNNEIEDLLPYNLKIQSEYVAFSYDTRKYIPINEFANKYEILNKEHFESELTKFKNKINSYMLNENNIILREDVIYVSKEIYERTHEVHFKFIYVPLKEKLINYDDEILRIKNNTSLFNIDKQEILVSKNKLLDEILSEDEIYDEKQKKKSIIKKIIIGSFIILLFLFRNNKVLSIVTLSTFILSLILMYVFKVTEEEKNYDEMYDDSTMIIQNFPYLRKSLLDEKIFINKDEFKIGKDKSNDFIIETNSISRKHAKIYKKDSNYYIEDNNSTNHTYVNDEEMKNNMSKMLFNGDKIRFGKEQYLFYYEV